MAKNWAFLQSSCVARLLGIVINNPVSLVLEDVFLGPLDSYLRENRQVINTIDLVEACANLASALWHLVSVPSLLQDVFHMQAYFMNQLISLFLFLQRKSMVLSMGTYAAGTYYLPLMMTKASQSSLQIQDSLCTQIMSEFSSQQTMCSLLSILSIKFRF